MLSLRTLHLAWLSKKSAGSNTTATTVVSTCHSYCLLVYGLDVLSLTLIGATSHFPSATSQYDTGTVAVDKE
jgi:hypothetical protein